MRRKICQPGAPRPSAAASAALSSAGPVLPRSPGPASRSRHTGSAYMAVQQNKALGMVANTMTITKLVNESKTAGQPLKMIEEPMAFQPIGVGMQKDQPALLAKVNETLLAMDQAGEINALWDKWL